MTNITVAEGGGIVANGVVSFLPQCAPVSYDSLSLQDAKQFDITDASYLVAIIPTIVPGLVFGILSVLGFIFFSLWLCTQCCGRRRRVCASSEKAQFITSAEQQSAEYAAAPPQGWRQRRWAQPPFLLKLLLTAVALTVAGICAWGMVGSINATDDTFSSLWDLVRDVEGRVDNATTTMQQLSSELQQLNGNVTLLANETTSVLNFTEAAVQKLVAQGYWNFSWNAPELVKQEVSDKVTALLSLPDSIADVQQGIEAGFNTLQVNIDRSLSKIQDVWEDPTMALQERWRFIPITVVFGTTAGMSLLCALLFWRLRWYRTATCAAAILWLDVALLMLLGVGLFNGVVTVSTDSCQYAEFMLLQLVPRKVSDEESQQLLLNGFQYYFGLTAIPDDNVTNELLGIPTYLLRQFVTNPTVELATNLTMNLSPTEVRVLSQASGVPFDAMFSTFLLLPNISDTLWYLESQVLKSSIDPLYHDIKQYLCCTLSSDMGDLFAAWTVAGVLGFLLALLCSARLAQHALSLRKQQRRAMAAAAAASARHWHAPDYPPLQHNGLGAAAGNGVEDKAASTAECELPQLPVADAQHQEDEVQPNGFSLRTLPDEEAGPPTPPPPAAGGQD
ncbi:hypothetical protein ABPG75_010341 [Micractinium tetrahymenae]